MIVYAESSAVLAWLLDQSRAADVEAALGSADRVTTSALTLVECDRALHRLVGANPSIAAHAGSLRARLEAAVGAWGIEPMTGSIVARARSSFPDDNIRSLDALHLATALVVQASIPDLAVLSLDERIRANARALGFRVVPD